MARILGEAIGLLGEISGYVLLADARSMSEVSGQGDLTLDYVDLSVMDPEDAELTNTVTGRSFRVAVAEIASIEANRSIANMDFHEFADATAPDGVFRGFEAADFQEPVWPVERVAWPRPGRSYQIWLEMPAPAHSVAPSATSFLKGSSRERGRACSTEWVTRLDGPPCMGGSGAASLEVGSEAFHDVSLPDFEGTYEQHGEIRTRILEVDKPSRVAKAWNWLLPGASSHVPLREHQTLLESDALVTIEFTTAPSTGEVDTTLVRLHLMGIPVEWEDNFRALWNWDIARFATQD